MFYFFFQAEDGIRDLTVTGVQTCALPIFLKVFPVIDLRLINKESRAVLITFTRPARVARLIGSGVGGNYFDGQRKKRCGNDDTLEKRSVWQFHRRVGLP